MRQTTSSTADPPIPRSAIAELETALGRSLDGWDRCPPRHVTPSPGEGVEGAYFDVAAVVKVVQQLQAMPHTAGRWARTPFDPEPWQIVCILAPVFGWKYATGYRIVRTLYVEIPKKNGKTSLAARLALILLAGDGEWGAEVYAGAGSRDQAGFVFEPAKTVVEKSPALSGKLQVLAAVIRAPRTGGVFRVLSKAGDLSQGANVHGGVLDELHVYKDRSLIDAIEKGTAAREQPLIVIITTADDGGEGTIYVEKHGYVIALAERRATNPGTYGVIWSAEVTDDPFDEKTWIKANPNYPISPTKAFLENQASIAKVRPSALPAFLRLHLNVRVADEGQRVDWNWAASAGMVVEDKLKGRQCWGGLVTRSTQDLTAIAWTFRSPEKTNEWWTIWRHFIPESSLAALNERTNFEADGWRRSKKLIVTEGNVIDLEAHLEQLRTDSVRFDVRELGFDPNGAIGIVQPIESEDRFTCVAMNSNSASSAVVDWEALVRGKRYRHGGNPIVTWQMSNVVLRETQGEVVKIGSKISHDVVPGVVAAEIALRRALLGREEPSSEMVLTYR